MTKPLHVVVTWDDAADRSVTCAWDGTFDTARKIAEVVRPYRDREAVGYLGFVDEEYIYLASDYDREDGELSKWCVLPHGWVTHIKTARGRTIYRRTA